MNKNQTNKQTKQASKILGEWSVTFFPPGFYLAKRKFYILRKHLISSTKYHLSVYFQTLFLWTYILIVIDFKHHQELKAAKEVLVSTHVNNNELLNLSYSLKTICSFI